jgi:hypothetical protein
MLTSAAPGRLYQCIYGSAAVRLLSETELVALLARCRGNNARLGVTGMLLYKDGSFLQVFEGEHDVIGALYDRIQSDPLHRAVTQWCLEPITARAFAAWSMGFRDLSRGETPPPDGFADFLDRPAQHIAGLDQRTLAATFLEVFRRHM